MISWPGCKAFEYVQKNGFSRFLQKSQTQTGLHRTWHGESWQRNHTQHQHRHQGAPSLWEPARPAAAPDHQRYRSDAHCRSLWPTSCHLAFKRFSAWRAQWAVTIPEYTMRYYEILWSQYHYDSDMIPEYIWLMHIVYNYTLCCLTIKVVIQSQLK